MSYLDCIITMCVHSDKAKTITAVKFYIVVNVFFFRDLKIYQDKINNLMWDSITVISKLLKLTNSMAYGSQNFNDAFTMAL